MPFAWRSYLLTIQCTTSENPIWYLCFSTDLRCREDHFRTSVTKGTHFQEMNENESTECTEKNEAYDSARFALVVYVGTPVAFTGIVFNGILLVGTCS